MSAAYYRYQAYDAQGNVLTGQVNAESEREALKILQGKKLIPVKISRADSAGSKGGGKKRLKARASPSRQGCGN